MNDFAHPSLFLGMKFFHRDRENIEQGIQQGIQQGLELGERKMAALANILFTANRPDDLKRAVNNPEYRAELFKEHGF